MPNVVHIVVKSDSSGMQSIICTAAFNSDQPAVYHDASPAADRCKELQDKYPFYKFRVLSTPVL
jgi:hypothetical protein